MMRSASPGQFERDRRAIGHDDLGRAQSLQDLDADMPETTGSDNHSVLAGQEMARGFLGSAIGRETGVGIGSDVLGRERLRKLDKTARAGQKNLGIAAIGIDPREYALFGVHVVAATTRQTMTAGDKWMADNRVALLEPGDALANLFNPAGVLVPHDIRQVDVGFFAPDSFDDMEIGSANAGTADSDDHVRGILKPRIDDIFVADEFLGAQGFVVTMQNGGFHLPVPSFFPPPQRGFDIFCSLISNCRASASTL